MRNWTDFLKSDVNAFLDGPWEKVQQELLINYNSSELYKSQRNKLANFLILKDRAIFETEWDSFHFSNVCNSDIVWLNRGEIVAGSFVANRISLILGYEPKDTVQHGDIDIYFKSYEDARDFVKLNFENSSYGWFLDNTHDHKGMINFNLKSSYNSPNSEHINLIWGIGYTSPDFLIRTFDIRAISTAYDPATKNIYFVKGSISDISSKRIVWNPIPNFTSVSRLVKYTQKGFHIDAFQRAYFAELIKTEVYSYDLELSTGYAKVQL